MNDYIKSTDELPKEFTPVWVCVGGRRPRKMYLVHRTFFYYNKLLRQMYCSIGDNVLWKYVENN